MRTALIAPIDLLDMQMITDMQLMLPHIKHPEYQAFYKGCRKRGDFLILDNGAAEGISLPDNELLSMAVGFEANELAVPDVLGDSAATLSRADVFFHDNKGAALLAIEHGVQFGLVTQGQTHREAMQTVNQIASSWFEPYVKTLFLPRLLLEKGDLYARIALAQNIRVAYGDRYNLHFFGTNTHWIQEVMTAQREVPHVRSIDTSAPFNYAIARERIWSSSKIKRPNDYFEQSCSARTREYADDNVDRFLAWADGVD